MIKSLYKIIGLIFTAFILFLFFINFNLFSYKENIFIRVIYSIKVNLIYYLYYLIYMFIYIRYIHHK